MKPVLNSHSSRAMFASVDSGAASRASRSGGAGGPHSLDFPSLPEVLDLPWLRFTLEVKASCSCLCVWTVGGFVGPWSLSDPRGRGARGCLHGCFWGLSMVFVSDDSCESNSVFPVDSPAAKRLKVTPTQHDPIDPTPAGVSHSFSQLSGPGLQTSLVGNPNLLSSPSGVSTLLPARRFRRLALAHLCSLLLP